MHSQVVTFWEGEIVDGKNYTFFTGKWEATYVFLLFLEIGSYMDISNGGKAIIGDVIVDYLLIDELEMSMPFLMCFRYFNRSEDDIRHWTKFPSFSPFLVRSQK